MRYCIYADLSRRLTGQEQSTLFEVLDSTVPGSGCIGPQKGRPYDEVYFSVDAPTAVEAREKAAGYLTILLQQAGLDINYTLTLQPGS